LPGGLVCSWFWSPFPHPGRDGLSAFDVGGVVDGGVAGGGGAAGCAGAATGGGVGLAGGGVGFGAGAGAGGCDTGFGLGAGFEAGAATGAGCAAGVAVDVAEAAAGAETNVGFVCGGRTRTVRCVATACAGRERCCRWMWTIGGVGAGFTMRGVAAALRSSLGELDSNAARQR
jgi:hypothetical protein